MTTTRTLPETLRRFGRLRRSEALRGLVRAIREHLASARWSRKS